MPLFFVRAFGALIIGGALWAIARRKEDAPGWMTIGFLLWFAVAYVGNSALLIAGSMIPAGVELPISRVCGMTTDAEGRRYFGSAEYSRIQVYSSAGQYLGSRFVPSQSYFRFWIQDGLLHVVASGNLTKYIYDSNGILISEHAISKEQYRTESEKAETAISGFHSFPFPHFEDGEEERHFPGGLMIALSFPWPAMSGVLFGGLLYAIRLVKIRQRQKQTL